MFCMAKIYMAREIHFRLPTDHSVVSIEYPNRMAAAYAQIAPEPEPLPGLDIFQLEICLPEQASVGSLCADFCHKGDVLNRVVHVHAGHNRQLNEADHFLWAFRLPGGLCINKCM